jgi:hypothetical protein
MVTVRYSKNLGKYVAGVSTAKTPWDAEFVSASGHADTPEQAIEVAEQRLKELLLKLSN